MKKIILLTLGAFFLIFIVVFIIAFIMSFKVVKKNTDSINASLKKEFARIVLIPDVVGPSFKSLETVSYKWDMVTNENEITPVEFTHDTAIARNQNKIIVILQMPEGADPSIFHKVIPAVVSDAQTVSGLEDLEDANLGPSEELGYNKVELYKSTSGKVIEIVWEFDKDKLTKDSKVYYNNLYQYPEWLVKILYTTQQSTLLFLKP